jgi:hypothetical protein
MNFERMFMKKIFFLLCGVAAICLMVSTFASDQKQLSQTDSKTDVGQLTQQVTFLQARIKTLEERLAKLEKDRTIKLVNSPLVANPAPNSITIPGVGADPNRPPNALSEREFNGLKYYMIPLRAETN